MALTARWRRVSSSVADDPRRAYLLAGLADGGRVDDGHHLLEIVEQQAIEQGLVAALQRLQEDVLFDVGLERTARE